MPRRDRPQQPFSRRAPIVVQRDDLVVPHDLDVERTVLGTMLVSDEAAKYGCDRLEPIDFFRHEHVLLFGVCRALVQEGASLDFVTVHTRLKLLGIIEAVGGPAEIARLPDGVPRATNINHYANVLRDLRLRREALAIADRIVADVSQGEASGADLLGRIDGWVAEAERAQGGTPFQTPSEATAQLLAYLERRQDMRGGVTGIPTGFKDLDEMTGGWQPGHLIVLAARPSIGKSAMMACLALAAAKQGHGVGIFSLEMPTESVNARFASMLSGVMLYKMQRGSCTENDQRRVGEAMALRADLPIYVDDTAGISAPQIRAKARQLQASAGAGLIVVDYLQLASGGGQYDNRQVEVAAISRDLKVCAMDLRLPVIALSQLSRASESRQDPRPRLTDLRESGAIEQDADAVIFLHREDHKAAGRTEVIIEKQRDGPTGPIELHFVRETVQFTEPKA